MELTDYQGKLIEYLCSTGSKLGVVTGTGKGRLQVRDRNGRNESVAPNRLLVVHSNLRAISEFDSAAAELEEKITREVAGIDSDFLWESLQDEPGMHSIEELAEYYFGESNPVRMSALFRLALEDRLRFRVRGLEIQARPGEQVNADIEAARRQREKEEAESRAVNWLRGVLLAEESPEVPDGMRDTARLLENYLLGPGAPNVERWLQEIRPQEDPREVAFEILGRLGLLPVDSDRFLVIAGIQSTFSRRAREAADALVPFQPQEGRLDLSHLEAFAIDDEDTREVDDAITVERVDSLYRVGIHIADVSHFVGVGDPLFDEAMVRRTSVYLPHVRVPMLPPRLSWDLASLNPGEIRPTMSFLVNFTEAGDVTSWEIRSAQIRVGKRLSYDELDGLLQDGDGFAHGRLMKKLDAFAGRLENCRIAGGALSLKKPEIKLSVENDEVNVSWIEADSPSRRIVSEMMILANQLAAQYAFLREVPVIYRVQGPPRREIKIPEHYDPLAYDAIFRKLEKSRFSLTRQSHHGLGLAGYTQLTSPIRRLGDLAIQQQVSADLKGESLPFQAQELFEILSQAEAGEKMARALERKALRFYLLRYLQEKRKDVAMDATVVMKSESGALVETSDLLVRGRFSSRNPAEIGDVVRVVISRIEPEQDTLVFSEV